METLAQGFTDVSAALSGREEDRAAGFTVQIRFDGGSVFTAASGLFGSAHAAPTDTASETARTFKDLLRYPVASGSGQEPDGGHVKRVSAHTVSYSRPHICFHDCASRSYRECTSLTETE
jgi:hypothetical protein